MVLTRDSISSGFIRDMIEAGQGVVPFLSEDELQESRRATLAVAPEGIFGGEAGQAGSFSVNGEPVTTQARITLAPGDVVRLDLPGGGGYGDPVPEEIGG